MNCPHCKMSETEIKTCYLCEKNDELTFPVIINKLLVWICRRHPWRGRGLVNAFTGFPIDMAIVEEEEYPND